MSRNAVSRSYGRALFEAARELEVLPRVMQDLENLELALGTEMQALLLSPRVPMAQRVTIVREIFQSSSDLFISFLVLVIRKGRAGALQEMIEEVREQDHKAAGRAVCELHSAEPVADDLKEEIRMHMSRLTGLDLRLKETVDPELLGGFVAQVGNSMLDASLRTRLDQLRRHLKAV